MTPVMKRSPHVRKAKSKAKSRNRPNNKTRKLLNTVIPLIGSDGFDYIAAESFHNKGFECHTFQSPQFAYGLVRRSSIWQDDSKEVINTVMGILSATRPLKYLEVVEVSVKSLRNFNKLKTFEDVLEKAKLKLQKKFVAAMRKGKQKYSEQEAIEIFKSLPILIEGSPHYTGNLYTADLYVEIERKETEKEFAERCAVIKSLKDENAALKKEALKRQKEEAKARKELEAKEEKRRKEELKEFQLRLERQNRMQQEKDVLYEGFKSLDELSKKEVRRKIEEAIKIKKIKTESGK